MTRHKISRKKILPVHFPSQENFYPKFLYTQDPVYNEKPQHTTQQSCSQKIIDKSTEKDERQRQEAAQLLVLLLLSLSSIPLSPFYFLCLNIT